MWLEAHANFLTPNRLATCLVSLKFAYPPSGVSRLASVLVLPLNW